MSEGINLTLPVGRRGGQFLGNRSEDRSRGTKQAAWEMRVARVIHRVLFNLPRKDDNDVIFSVYLFFEIIIRIQSALLS